MSIRRVLALGLRIVRQIIHDRRTLAVLFLAPLLVMTILNFVLGGSTSGVTLGIVPPDGAAGDALVTQTRSALSGQSGLTVTRVARDQVDAALENGGADGVLIFPAQLGSGAPMLELEGSNPAVAQQLRGAVTQLVASAEQAQQAAASGQVAGGPATTAAPTPALPVIYLHGGPKYTQTDALAPIFVGMFAFFFTFLLTSVSFLRERSQGTIERLMVSPLSKTELVLGYVLGFTLFALIQSLLILLFVIYVLRVHYAGNLGLLFLVTAALTIGGVNMGIFASAFARNELQVIQFIPILLVPQILLGGLFFPVATLPPVLKQIAEVLPLTYANFALKDVMLKGFGLGEIWPDLVFLAGFAMIMVIAAAVSLRQERI